MTSDTHTLLLIPARGGSKRLVGKSLRTVGGVTLLGRAVAVARRAAQWLHASARVVVSTDDAEIADVARRCGAEVPFVRPAELATDDAPTIAVVRHALDYYSRAGETFREVVLLQPTSPLRIADDVVQTVRLHRSEPELSAVTVRKGDDGSPATRFALCNGLLREASTGGEAVVLNGAVYVFSPSWVEGRDALAVCGATRALHMPADRSVDVDTAADLARARAIWHAQSPWPQDGCHIIAEAGVNHDGDIDVARRLIDAADTAGADAVKFQTFDPERLATADAAKADYQQRTTRPGESQRGMLAGLALGPDDHHILKAHCNERGIAFLSSAFGAEDVDLLDALDVHMLKLGSGELTNHPLLAHAAATLRPVICSTGAAYLHEVADAVRVLRFAGCDHLALLHCVSAYPASSGDLNLRAMNTMARAFDVPVGFSDHTLSIEAACAAAALGARIIEKHLTLDRTRSGPDHRASLEPHEFSALVQAIRNVSSALGDGIKHPRPCEASVRETARRSLVAACDIETGTILAAEHVVAKRPGTGIAPGDLSLVLRRRVMCDIAADKLIAWDDLGPNGDAP